MLIANTISNLTVLACLHYLKQETCFLWQTVLIFKKQLFDAEKTVHYSIHAFKTINWGMHCLLISIIEYLLHSAKP